MRLGLTTALAHTVGHDPDRLVGALVDAGADFASLDASLPAPLLDELRPRLAARRDELPVLSVENVCPARREGAAQLASRDREEGRVAVAAARDTLELAAELGASIVELRLGEVTTLAAGWSHLRRTWRRGDLDEPALARRVRERAVLGTPHVDAARRSLDALARIADGLGVRLGVRNPARLIGLPTAIELRVLLADLTGAPIFPVWDVPAMEIAAHFGMPAADVAAAWATAPLLRLGDACAHLGGLPPGMGEIDLSDILGRASPDADAVFPPWTGLSLDEILDGTRALRPLLPSGTPQPFGPTSRV